MAFEEEINMVTDDAASDSLYKAMSADAFREFTDSRVTDDKFSQADNKTLSAKALKQYLNEKLVSYAKNADSVWYDAGVAVGSSVQGIYVEGTGKAVPVKVVYRGNATNDPNCFVIVPAALADGTWHYDYIKRSDLYNRFID